MLQALWRTSSTYWWMKFRENSDFHCYYEPLHENHEKQKQFTGNIEDIHKGYRGLNHPIQDRHQAEEYEVLPDGGIKGYSPSFPHKQYFMAANDDSPALESYIKGLISHAETKGKRPVFQFNRASLRAEWMACAFKGVHFYIVRDIADMYESHRALGEYVFGNFRDIIKENRNHNMFTGIAAFLDGFQDDKVDEVKRGMVGFFWVMALMQGSRYADLIIDTDLTAQNQETREDVEEKISNLTGYRPGLSDIKRRDRGALPLFKVPNEVKQIIQSALQLQNPDMGRISSASLSDAKKAFLDHVLS